MKAIILALLVGCMPQGAGPYGVGWDKSSDGTILVRAESLAPLVTQDEWTTIVQTNFDLWEGALSSLSDPATGRGPGFCHSPIKLTTDPSADHAIQLLPEDKWTANADIEGQELPGVLGNIVVKASTRSDDAGTFPVRFWGTILHEEGHAFGLLHSDPTAGDSVMWQEDGVGFIERRDVAAAACVLGCDFGCDASGVPTPDAYSLGNLPNE